MANVRINAIATEATVLESNAWFPLDDADGATKKMKGSSLYGDIKVPMSFKPLNNTQFWRVKTPDPNNEDFGWAFHEVANPVGSIADSTCGWGYNPRGEASGDGNQWNYTIEAYWKASAGVDALMEQYEVIRVPAAGANFRGNGGAVNLVTGRKVYQYLSGDLFRFYDGRGTVLGAELLRVSSDLTFAGTTMAMATGVGACTFGMGTSAVLSTQVLSTIPTFRLSTQQVRFDLPPNPGSGLKGTTIFGDGLPGTNNIYIVVTPTGTAPYILASGEAAIGLRIAAGGTGSVRVTPHFKVGADTNADASSICDLQSTTKGFLPPRMTTTQRDAIATPAAGLHVWNTTTKAPSWRRDTGTPYWTSQQAKINDPTGGAFNDAEARTAINAIIDVLEHYGLSAGIA